MAKTEKATFAGGCFWCTEAIFQQLKGVKSVVSGYCGGDSANPDYWSIHRGKDTHAESIQIVFDPQIISYKDLLEVFLKTHDPTTLNRQGVDVGTEYRSAVFYHSPEQQRDAEQVIDEINKSGYYKDPIVTEVSEFKMFTKAENYHQDYYNKNQGNMYCTVMIDPKLTKLKKDFGSFVK